ncbi:MAG TPA: 2-isopropylmalate synthase [Candidatus Saccharimonadales bacterium]|nr:2-isopropylmalate synthase [Candidatus Saccharimonadales bacterium]
MPPEGQGPAPGEASPERTEANRVHIFDTTLRDGEQSPGVSLNTAEKVEIAHQLARLGVDVIEAGFPITSPGDFEATQAIARQVEGPVICGLARTHKADIDRAWEAVRDSERPRIHTFISTSDIHIEHQLQTDREDVKGQARAAVALAKSYTEDVEFSPMDATRADFDFTAEVCAIAVEEGATVLNIPDTVGYTTPEEYADYWRRLFDAVPELGSGAVRGSVHCHDDLGLAVANSYAGLLAGARQVECAVNGIGERAGNASEEEIAMLIRVREALHKLWTGINTREIMRTSRMVSRSTGYSVQPNKAVVGRNAFAHESGIHQDGILKERETYEIMDATEVGLESNSLVLGKHSGRHALKDALEQLGYDTEQININNTFKQFKEVADRKKQVTAMDLEALVSEEVREASETYHLEGFELAKPRDGEPSAKVAVKMPDGSIAEGEATGDGPVDAVFNAIKNATETNYSLAPGGYKVDTVSGGEDAMGDVSVTLVNGGEPFSGTASGTDIIETSARAYTRALSFADRRKDESDEAEGPKEVDN